MSALDEFAANHAPLQPTPKGYEAVVETGEREGTASNIALPEAASADDAALMRGAGLDPEAWEIEPGTRRHKRWQRYDGEWLNWWSFTFRERRTETPEQRAEEIGDLQRLFRKKPVARTHVQGTDAFVFWITDWQTGKNSLNTIEHVRSALPQVKAQIKHLRKMGYALPTLFIPSTGDLVEGCDGNYSQQTYGVDLDRRGQVKVARRLVREIIEELAPMFTAVHIVAVPGNHGEHRREGKSFTTDADNDDVAIFDMLQEVFAVRPEFDHVTFQIADGEMSTCVDIVGVPVGLTHGHLLRSGGKLAANKAKEWWTGQIWGLQPVSKARILLSGHYHHFVTQTFGPRTWMQSPAIDGGSKYFTDYSGEESPDGIVTMRLDANSPLGWDHVRII